MPEIPALQTNNLDVSNSLFKLAEAKRLQEQDTAQQKTRDMQNILYKRQIEGMPSAEQMQQKNALDAAQVNSQMRKEQNNEATDYLIRAFQAKDLENWDTKYSPVLKKAGVNMDIYDKGVKAFIKPDGTFDYVRAKPFIKSMINANKGLIEDKDMQVLDLYDSKTGEFAMPLPYVIGEKVNIPQGLTSIKPDKSLTAKEERKLALDERRVEALEKGVALREKNVNEKTAKTNIKSYRDPYTGTTKYYDLNNPDEAKIVKGAGVINPKTGKPKYVLEEISSFKKQDAEDETINTPYGKTNTNTSKKLYENYK